MDLIYHSKSKPIQSYDPDVEDHDSAVQLTRTQCD